MAFFLFCYRCAILLIFCMFFRRVVGKRRQSVKKFVLFTLDRSDPPEKATFSRCPRLVKKTIQKRYLKKIRLFDVLSTFVVKSLSDEVDESAKIKGLEMLISPNCLIFNKLSVSCVENWTPWKKLLFSIFDRKISFFRYRTFLRFFAFCRCFSQQKRSYKLLFFLELF